MIQRTIFLISINLLLCFSSLCLYAAQSIVLYPEPNRPLFVQYEPSHESKPTFLLLPGMNRGWLATDTIAKKLTTEGYGYISFNFSPHAFSVAQLKSNQIAPFETKPFALSDLASEFNFVYQYFKSQVPSVDSIPVTLSYSGLISPLLNSFSQIIDVAPLTSAAVAYPDFEQFRQWLKSLELFNPVFGPFWTRSQLDLHYRNHWSKKVDEFILEYQLPDSNRSRMIEGHVSLSRAAEGTAWPTPLSKQVRTLVLAEKEAPALLQNQISYALEALQQNVPIQIYFVKNAGHVIPSQQPEVFVIILNEIASRRLNSNQNFDLNFTLIITDSSDPDQWTRLNKKEALEWLRNAK